MPFKTKVLMKDGSTKDIKSTTEPEITAEIGFLRFWFEEDKPNTILVNSDYIVSVSVDYEEEKTQDGSTAPAIPNE